MSGFPFTVWQTAVIACHLQLFIWPALNGCLVSLDLLWPKPWKAHCCNDSLCSPHDSLRHIFPGDMNSGPVSPQQRWCWQDWSPTRRTRFEWQLSMERVRESSATRRPSRLYPSVSRLHSSSSSVPPFSPHTYTHTHIARFMTHSSTQELLSSLGFNPKGNFRCIPTANYTCT